MERSNTDRLQPLNRDSNEARPTGQPDQALGGQSCDGKAENEFTLRIGTRAKRRILDAVEVRF